MWCVIARPNKWSPGHKFYCNNHAQKVLCIWFDRWFTYHFYSAWSMAIAFCLRARCLTDDTSWFFHCQQSQTSYSIHFISVLFASSPCWRHIKFDLAFFRRRCGPSIYGCNVLILHWLRRTNNHKRKKKKEEKVNFRPQTIHKFDALATTSTAASVAVVNTINFCWCH